MAQGFDSKSVADQQEEAERVIERARERNATRPEAITPRRRSLELARLDLAHRLELAPESRRDELRRALDELDKLIAGE
jgi:hypothetical protein